MLIKKLMPDGWPCTLGEAPPGPMTSCVHPDQLWFKSEYTADGNVTAFNMAGEYLCVGPDEMVQPVTVIIEDEPVER